MVTLQFSARVTIRLPEIELVRTDDPLFLIGTDILGPRRVGWKFMHVGYCPRQEKGLIGFYRDRGVD